MTNPTLRMTASDTRLEVSGDIDISNAGALKDAIARAAKGSVVQHVTVDLARVEFMDASGLRALVGATSVVAPTKVVLSHPPPNIRRVLDLGAPGMFDIED